MPLIHSSSSLPSRAIAPLIAVLALLLLLPAQSLAAATPPLRFLEDGEVQKLNDNGDVVGTETNGVGDVDDQQAVLWKGGARTVLAGPAGAQVVRIGAFWNDGRFAALVNTGTPGQATYFNIATWTNRNPQMVGSPLCGTHYAANPLVVWLGASTWGAGVQPCNNGANYIEFGGQARFTGELRSYGMAGASDNDAGMATIYPYDLVANTSTLHFIDPDRGIDATWPGGALHTPSVGRGGVIFTGDRSGPYLLRLQPDKASFVRTNVPALPTEAGLKYSSFNTEVNGAGTVVVYLTTDLAGGPAKAFRLKPGAGAWEDITPLFAAEGRTFYGIADINEWGDLLGVYGTGIAETSGAVYAPRTVLTGTVTPTTGAGSGRAGVKGLTVQLDGGPAQLTATTDAKGGFSLDVPPAFAGLTLAAPAGTCVRTATGCHTAVPLEPLAATAKPVKLDALAAKAAAAFTAKKGTALKVSGTKTVSTVVRCNAAAPCVATVTLRAGRAVYGTGRVTVPAGKTKAVVVKLSAAAIAKLATTARVPVGATLVARAATKPKATTVTSVQSFALLR